MTFICFYMLPGPSFRSAFVFSINSLILLGNPPSILVFHEPPLSCQVPLFENLVGRSIPLPEQKWRGGGCTLYHGGNPIFFNKKNKGWTPRTLTNPPTPLRPITSHFCLTPYPPQSGRHMFIAPNNAGLFEITFLGGWSMTPQPPPPSPITLHILRGTDPISVKLYTTVKQPT